MPVLLPAQETERNTQMQVAVGAFSAGGGDRVKNEQLVLSGRETVQGEWRGKIGGRNKPVWMYPVNTESWEMNLLGLGVLTIVNLLSDGIDFY